MQQRFAAAERDDRGAERGQLVEPFQHYVGRNGRREVIVLVTVGAGEIAPADGNDVRHHGVIGRRDAFEQHAPLARAPVQGPDVSAEFKSQVRHRQGLILY